MPQEHHSQVPAQGEQASGAEMPGGQRPKRLPLLWIICVLFGLAGVVHLTAVLLAKPLGILWFGLLSLVCFAAALGLWRRLNVARIGVTALLASVCVLLLLAYARDPSGWAALSPA